MKRNVTRTRRGWTGYGRAGLLVLVGLGVASAWLVVGEPASDPTASRFDGGRAFRDLQDLVAIGPRPAGSSGGARARELIAERLRQSGWPVETRAFRAQTPAGEVLELANLVATRPGRRAEPILLGAHYDTKRIPGVHFVGANDGASGVAVLLETARQLAIEPLDREIRLLFFDGEEAVGRDITLEDGLYGSRALAREMAASGELRRVRALILVDMVGDSDLNLTNDTSSSPRLRRQLAVQAERLGLTELLDARASFPVVDDHTPFAQQGLAEVLALIDFQYGARRTPGPLWHTAGDDLSAVSAESLNSVGALLVQLVRTLQEGG